MQLAPEHSTKWHMARFIWQKCFGIPAGVRATLALTPDIGPDPGRTNSHMHWGAAFKPRPGPTSPAQSGTPAAPGSRQYSAESAPRPCTPASAQPWGARRAEEAHDVPLPGTWHGPSSQGACMGAEPGHCMVCTGEEPDACTGSTGVGPRTLLSWLAASPEAGQRR